MPDDPMTAGIDLAKKALEVAYPDALQPAAKEFGTSAAPAGKELAKAGVTLARTINLALLPLEGMVWGWDKVREIVLPELGKRFEQKLHRLVTPKANVAIPALEAMRYSADEPELQRMYVNLLETAMDRETAEKAHPAFAEIMRQLTPDEARIFEYVAKHELIRIECKADKEHQLLLDKIATPSGCQFPHLFYRALGNLKRLALVDGSSVANGSLDAPPLDIITVVAMTPFGKQFYAACVAPPAV